MATRSPFFYPLGCEEGGEARCLLPGFFEAQALVLVDDESFVASGLFEEVPEACRGVLKDAAGLAIVQLRLELIGLDGGGQLRQGLISVKSVACGHAVFSPFPFSMS